MLHSGTAVVRREGVEIILNVRATAGWRAAGEVYIEGSQLEIDCA